MMMMMMITTYAGVSVLGKDVGRTPPPHQLKKWNDQPLIKSRVKIPSPRPKAKGLTKKYLGKFFEEIIPQNYTAGCVIHMCFSVSKFQCDNPMNNAASSTKFYSLLVKVLALPPYCYLKWEIKSKSQCQHEI